MTTAADGLLDTSTLILLNELVDEVQLPEYPVISSITLAELSVGPLVAKTEHERKVRQLHLQIAESEFDSLPFNETAARIYGGIAAELRNSGSKRKARAFDTLIAAIAIAHQLPLYTVNPSDYAGISDLDVRAVPHPHQR